MPGNPEQCRIYAQMCRLLAGNSPDEAWREHFTEFALNWEHRRRHKKCLWIYPDNGGHSF